MNAEQMRFARKVVVGEGRCWLWQAGKDRDGYGVFHSSEAQKSVAAHRRAYELFRGPIPEGLQIDHLCRTRACVNPAHLEPVTVRENSLRSEAFVAVNARKTHCNQGHPLTGANLRVNPRGARVCKRCEADAQARCQARKRARAS